MPWIDDGLAELLDDFALAALQGALANPALMGGKPSMPQVAALAYQQAAACLEVRERLAEEVLKRIRHGREFLKPRQPHKEGAEQT